MLHSIFRTPAPPGDAFAQDASHVLVVMTILIPISLGFLAFAIFESKRFKTSIPIGLVVAGIFCVVPEAVNNYLGGVHWTQSHDPKQLLFMLMGREFDYYVAFICTGTLWAHLALAVLADIILEEVLLGYDGIYLYFGRQPLVFNLFPCCWGPAYISTLFLSITLAYRYRAWFEGWRSSFLLPLVRTCYIGAWTLCGMPTVFAIKAISLRSSPSQPASTAASSRWSRVVS
ncbi:hypothetical protein D6C94_09021 [Aureobasidium pullulans]|uniref:EBP-domain-containing protein n=1 Tax=Aureobasidium pullulans TaxID=5580 RepID=A0AB38LLU1_AURPU|nr:hypothetical protein D6C94_09021 [Aureobasidium pullulans]